MSIITYHITSDYNGKLRESAKLSCNFWNRFLVPQNPIVIRLGKFTSFGSTIARAYEPYFKDGTVYGVVEFNTKYLKRFSEEQIVGTIIHEIGHTLGMGWDKWMSLFNSRTGKFHKRFIKRIAALENMEVETDYGPGTTLSHWDEVLFDKEVMSGFKDDGEYVLPVTIDVFELLGHQVIERLEKKTSLSEILKMVKGVQFSMAEDAQKLDREFYVETEIWEEVYNNKRSESPDS